MRFWCLPPIQAGHALACHVRYNHAARARLHCTMPHGRCCSFKATNLGCVCVGGGEVHVLYNTVAALSAQLSSNRCYTKLCATHIHVRVGSAQRARGRRPHAWDVSMTCKDLHPPLTCRPPILCGPHARHNCMATETALAFVQSVLRPCSTALQGLRKELAMPALHLRPDGIGAGCCTNTPAALPWLQQHHQPRLGRRCKHAVTRIKHLHACRSRARQSPSIHSPSLHVGSRGPGMAHACAPGAWQCRRQHHRRGLNGRPSRP